MDNYKTNNIILYNRYQNMYIILDFIITILNKIDKPPIRLIQKIYQNIIIILIMLLRKVISTKNHKLT